MSKPSTPIDYATRWLVMEQTEQHRRANVPCLPFPFGLTLTILPRRMWSKHERSIPMLVHIPDMIRRQIRSK